jgi:predicted ArsR family transcriptional regulator
MEAGTTLRRDHPPRSLGPAAGPPDDLDASLADLAVLAEPLRRRIFQLVRRGGRPATRDEVAAAAGISRRLAAFHLDRLVGSGLLCAHSQGATGIRKVGRRPKVYEAGRVRIRVSIPERQPGVLADILLATLLDPEAGDAVRGVATRAAHRHGVELGRAARWLADGAGPGPGSGRAPEWTALETLGFEPYEEVPGVVRLRNCPFQPLADRSPELVCGLNHTLLAGVLAGMRTTGVEAVLIPRAGECCVEIRMHG